MMYIKIVHKPSGELFNSNYLMRSTFAIDEEATSDSAVNAFAEALEIDGYHNASIIKSFVKIASDIASDQELWQVFKEAIDKEFEEWGVTPKKEK